MASKLHLAGAAALGMAAAAAAQAEQHTVVVTGFSYFPAVVYAQPGDTIRFVNESGVEQKVIGKDSDWTVGPLQNREEGTLTVELGTEQAFYSAYEDSGDGSYEYAPAKAEFTFLEPPLAD